MIRNSSIHVLMPSACIVLAVDPPLTDREKPYVITVRGRQTVVVRMIDSGQVAVENPTDAVSLFMFFVGPRRLIADIPTLSRLFGGP